MIKRLLYVCILTLFAAAFSGCSDSGGGPDPLQDFRDAADALRDLNYYSQAEVADQSGDDFLIASDDLFIFLSFINPALNKTVNFTQSSYLNGVYTDTDRSTSITVLDNVYTLSMTSTKTLDGGQTTEVVQVDFSYNISTDRWLILAYRGGTSTSDPTDLWFKQEGDKVGGRYYVATSFYIEEEAVEDPPENAPIHISNLIYEGTADVLTSLQMALERDDTCAGDCVTATTEIYPDGVVAAGVDDWADFSIYNIEDDDPDYEILLP